MGVRGEGAYLHCFLLKDVDELATFSAVNFETVHSHWPKRWDSGEGMHVKHTNELALFLEGVSVVLRNGIMRREAAYFGVFNTLQTIQEPVRGLDDGEVDAKRL